MAWAAVHAQVVTKGAFLLYPSAQICVVVPKRAFAEADQLRLAKELEARVAPLKRGGGAVRALVLWVVLIVAFLALWQFLDAAP